MNDNRYFELLGRLSDLEKRIETLESKKLNGVSLTIDTPAQYSVTKKWNKNEVIDEIKTQARKHSINIRKASMAEGAGVIVEDNGKKVMLRRSRDYTGTTEMQDEFIFTGWSTVTDEEMSGFDAYIFAVHKNNDIFFFIFSNEQMQEVKSMKAKDNQGRYHFYLSQKVDEDYVDHREDIIIDLNIYHDNWSALH